MVQDFLTQTVYVLEQPRNLERFEVLNSDPGFNSFLQQDRDGPQLASNLIDTSVDFFCPVRTLKPLLDEKAQAK